MWFFVDFSSGSSKKASHFPWETGKCGLDTKAMKGIVIFKWS